MKLIKFEAPWCSICKQQDKELAKLNNVIIQLVNMDEDYAEPLASKYKVRSLPTIVIVDDNDEVIERFTGLTLANKLQEAWDTNNK